MSILIVLRIPVPDPDNVTDEQIERATRILTVMGEELLTEDRGA